MSEFTNYGRKNHIDFGDYIQYQNGTSRILHIYKVVGALKSNTYQESPDWHGAKETIHDKVMPVLNVVHCGLDETKVIRVKESDCIKFEKEPVDYHNPSDIAEIEQLKGEIEDLEEDIDEAERESFEKIERMEELLKRSKIAIEYAPGAFANVTIKKIDDLLGGVGDDIR